MATNPSQFYGIVRKPVFTEKSTKTQSRLNKYTFRVHPDATKPEIGKAIETLFSVEVVSVNVLKVQAKNRRVLGRPSRTTPWKKAIVTLKEGNTISLA